ncbi:MAG: hypothetical protein KDD44_06165 [Bdellovibrionales bacterium]|nr:hypothetical protein [Bdellovibrionales bacterium]
MSHRNDIGLTLLEILVALSLGMLMLATAAATVRAGGRAALAELALLGEVRHREHASAQLEALIAGSRPFLGIGGFFVGAIPVPHRSSGDVATALIIRPLELVSFPTVRAPLPDAGGGFRPACCLSRSAEGTHLSRTSLWMALTVDGPLPAQLTVDRGTSLPSCQAGRAYLVQAGRPSAAHPLSRLLRTEAPHQHGQNLLRAPLALRVHDLVSVYVDAQGMLRRYSHLSRSGQPLARDWARLRATRAASGVHITLIPRDPRNAPLRVGASTFSVDLPALLNLIS